MQHVVDFIRLITKNPHARALLGLYLPAILQRKTRMLIWPVLLWEGWAMQWMIKEVKVNINMHPDFLGGDFMGICCILNDANVS